MYSWSQPLHVLRIRQADVTCQCMFLLIDEDDGRFLPAPGDGREMKKRSLLIVALAAQLESTEAERSSRVCLSWQERVSAGSTVLSTVLTRLPFR